MMMFSFVKITDLSDFCLFLRILHRVSFYLSPLLPIFAHWNTARNIHAPAFHCLLRRPTLWNPTHHHQNASAAVHITGASNPKFDGEWNAHSERDPP
jgi:hypothetical protein